MEDFEPIVEIDDSNVVRIFFNPEDLETPGILQEWDPNTKEPFADRAAAEAWVDSVLNPALEPEVLEVTDGND